MARVVSQFRVVSFKTTRIISEIAPPKVWKTFFEEKNAPGGFFSNLLAGARARVPARALTNETPLAPEPPGGSERSDRAQARTHILLVWAAAIFQKTYSSSVRGNSVR